MKRSDSQLVEEAIHGDVEAFGELYDRYARLVRAISFDATGSIELAQDVTQEAFLRAYRALDELRDAAKFAPWLLSITRRVIQESLRVRTRDARLVSFADVPARYEQDEVALADQIQSLHRAMLQLDDAERIALHAIYLDDQAPAAAAQMLGLSRSGFYKLLSRARGRLRRLLAPTEDPA